MASPSVIYVTSEMDGASKSIKLEDERWVVIACKEASHDCIEMGRNEKTFAQALCHQLPQSKYKLPLRKPKIINGELYFVFSDLEMDRTAEDLKHALVLKFLSHRLSINILR